MKQYDKSVIAPVVAVLALVVGSVFHIVIDADVQTMIVEFVGMAVGVGVTLVGIFKNHKKNPS